MGPVCRKNDVHDLRLASRALASAVGDISSVSHAKHEHEDLLLMDLVDDPVVTAANSPFA